MWQHINEIQKFDYQYKNADVHLSAKALKSSEKNRKNYVLF